MIDIEKEVIKLIGKRAYEEMQKCHVIPIEERLKNYITINKEEAKRLLRLEDKNDSRAYSIT